MGKQKCSYKYMVTTALLVMYGNIAFPSRNTVPAAVYNKYLGRNNCCCPLRFPWASTLTIRGFLFAVYIWTVTAATGQCAIFHDVMLARPIDSMKWTSCVTFIITHLHYCWLLLVRPCKEHCLFPKMEHAGQVLKCRWRGWDDSMQLAWHLLVTKDFLVH